MSVIGRPLLINAFGGTKSGDIVSFGSSLKVGIEPVQAGSGDPSPDNVRPISGWSAVNVWRTGKNLLDITKMIGGILDRDGTMSGSAYITISEQTKDTITWSQSVTWKAVTSEYIPVTEGTTLFISLDEASTISYIILCWYDINKNFISRELYRGSSLQAKTAPNGAKYVRYSFQQENIGTYTYHNIMLSISSTATPYEPYSGNQYAITFPALGVNQWDEEWERGGIANATGEPVALNDRIRSKNFCRILPSTSYYVKVPTSNAAIYWYDINKNYINNSFPYNSVTTSLQNAYYFKVTLAGGVTTYNHDISINYPSTDHDYHPYTNTVYGGTLDVTNGVLTVDRAMVDLGTLDWLYYNDYFQTDKTQIGALGTRSGRLICSKYAYSTSAYKNGNIYQTASFIRIVDNAYSDAASFKAASSGVKLVYELATPVTYTMTPEEVGTILLQVGRNNVWADTGPVTFKFFN